MLELLSHGDVGALVERLARVFVLGAPAVVGAVALAALLDAALPARPRR